MDIHTLIQDAGESKAHPSLPKKGISKQYFPGFIRWPMRFFFMLFIFLDRFVQQIAKWIIRPPFKRVGKCTQRGNCCYFILFKKYPKIIDMFLLFWYREINGFFLREEKPQLIDGKAFWVMGCRYLKKDGKCKHYFFRPSICRSWPVIEHFGYPRVLKGCGFKAVLKGKQLKKEYQ